MPLKSIPPDFLTTRQAATLIGFSTKVIRQEITQGRLHSVREKRPWLIKRSELYEWIRTIERRFPKVV